MKGKTWRIALVVLAVVVIGAWRVGPEIWAWSWEKRWEAFRTEWEAKGEDFGVESHLPAAVPDAENFAAHPFVVWLTAGDPDFRQRLEEMDPEAVEGYSEVVRGGEAWSAASSLRSDPELCRRLHAHFRKFEAEIRVIEDAVTRPSNVARSDPAKGVPGAIPEWGKCGALIRLLVARGLLLIAAENEEELVEDLETLIRLGTHLREERSMLGLVMGAGADAKVSWLIEGALRGSSTLSVGSGRHRASRYSDGGSAGFRSGAQRAVQRFGQNGDVCRSGDAGD